MEDKIISIVLVFHKCAISWYMFCRSPPDYNFMHRRVISHFWCNSLKIQIYYFGIWNGAIKTTAGNEVSRAHKKKESAAFTKDICTLTGHRMTRDISEISCQKYYSESHQYPNVWYTKCSTLQMTLRRQITRRIEKG